MSYTLRLPTYRKDTMAASTWSIIFDLTTEDPAPIRDRILTQLRSEGLDVRSKTITTSALTAALKHPLMVPDPHKIQDSWMIKAHIKHRRNRQTGT